MKFRLFSLIVLLALVSVVPLAAQDSSEGFPVTVVDESGQEVTFTEPVDSIVCLTAGCQDHLHVLDMEPVGVADYSAIVWERVSGVPLPENVAIITVDLASYQPDLEQILALQPDVVMGGLGLHDGIRQPLNDAGIPVLLSYPSSLEEGVADLQMTAAITGQADQADEAVAALEARLRAYQMTVPDVASVMLVFSATGSEALFVETSSAQTCATLIAYQLADCPFSLDETAGQFAGFGYGTFTVEAILDADPDAIFFAGYDNQGVTDPALLSGISENPLWPELSAVQNERVYSIDAWTFSGQSGITLLGLAVDTTMTLLYPDTFPEPLTDTQVQAILAEQEGESTPEATPSS